MNLGHTHTAAAGKKNAAQGCVAESKNNFLPMINRTHQASKREKCAAGKCSGPAINPREFSRSAEKTGDVKVIFSNKTASRSERSSLDPLTPRP